MKKRREGWDNAGKQDAMRYIAGGITSWRKEEFFASGTKEAEEFTQSFFERMSFEPANKRILDIGCGVGRMTRAFADMFGEAHGVDFSSEIIRQAKELNSDKSNLFFTLNNGSDLSLYPNNFFDFCFSFAVFKHISDVRVIRSYIHEIYRVLKPGGLFELSFDVRSWGPSRMPILHRTLFNFLLKVGVVDKLVAFYFAGDSWKQRAYPGVWLSVGDCRTMLEASGLEVVETRGKIWYAGRKG